MQIIDYPLQEKMGEGLPFFRAYLQNPRRGEKTAPDYRYPAVVVCPGGGYTDLSKREGEPIALEFSARGYQTFVLHYSLLPTLFPQPLFELAQTMTVIREHADEWSLDPNRIAIAGFSAGGHLVASLGTFWNDILVKDAGFDPEMIRPNALIMGYAVVEDLINKKGFHFKDKILGERANDPLYQRFASIPDYITPDNPPAFLWHTASDTVVPIANSLHFCEGMDRAGVPFEMHIWPQGPHGLALANKHTSVGIPQQIHPEAEIWVDLAADWMRRMWK